MELTSRTTKDPTAAVASETDFLPDSSFKPLFTYTKSKSTWKASCAFIYSMIITIATADFSLKPCNNYICLDFMQIPEGRRKPINPKKISEMEYVALFCFSQESKIYVLRCQLNEQLQFPSTE